MDGSAASCLFTYLLLNKRVSTQNKLFAVQFEPQFYNYNKLHTTKKINKQAVKYTITTFLALQKTLKRLIKKLGAFRNCRGFYFCKNNT